MSILRRIAIDHSEGMIIKNGLLYLVTGPHKGKYALQFILPLRWKDYCWSSRDMVWGNLTVRMSPYKMLEVLWNPDYVDTWDWTA